MLVLPWVTRPAAQESPLPSPVIRSTTRLVQVNVVVRDKKGAPIGGLTKDDFTVLDQGKPQEIAFFAEQNGTLGLGAGKPLPPNTFTNRYEQTGQAPGSVTVILLDNHNTDWEDVASAKLQLIKFLKQLQPQDRVAIYTFRLELRVIQEFTQDSSKLLKAIEQYKPGLPPIDSAESADSGDPKLDALFDAASAKYSSWDYIERMNRTTAALKAIANRLARVPGRKNLIWLSSSFPIVIWTKNGGTDLGHEMRSFQPELDQVAAALLDANIAVYPVDPRGLVASGYSAKYQTYHPLDTTGLQRSFDTMDLLAETTGGRAFYSANDIAGSVRKAMDDGRLTYELAYHPNHGRWDGQFHVIQVKVRRPRVQIQARKGYFAVPEPQKNGDDSARQDELESASKSPVEFTSVGITVNIRRELRDSQPHLTLAVNLDAHDLGFTAQEGHRKGGIDLVFVQRDASGNALDAHEWHCGLDLDKTTYDSALRDGISILRDVPAKEGAVTVKVIVRDPSSSAIGSLTVLLKKLASPAGSGASAVQSTTGPNGNQR
jgi:VWFA-related protein